MAERIILLDGVFLAASEKKMESLAPWKLRGKGVFETMRFVPTPGKRFPKGRRYTHGEILKLKEHLSRLMQGLKRLKIRSPYDAEQLERLLFMTLETNKLDDARLRLTIWRSNKSKEIRISIIAVPYKVPAESVYRKGLKVSISPIRLTPKECLNGLKSIRYSPFIRSLRLASAKGFDEAILLDKGRQVIEASRSNIFYFKDGKLFTPALNSGCLNGVTRQAVIDLAGRLKVKVSAAKVTLKDLGRADEIFLTNSLVGVMPVTTIEEKKVGKGSIGPRTRHLLKQCQSFLNI